MDNIIQLNEENNVISTTNLLDQRNHASYDKQNNMLTYIQPGRGESEKYTLEYGGTESDSSASEEVKQKRHLVTRMTTPLGHRTDTVYDKYGNVKSGKVSHRKLKPDDPTIQTSAEYTVTNSTAGTHEGNYAVKAIDARGNAVTTATDPAKGLTRSVTDPNGQSVSYAYDPARRVIETKATVGNKDYKNTYTYKDDRLETVSHNTGEGMPDVKYTFAYDALGNQTTVKAGAQTLSTNVYSATGDKLLERVDYGNGGKVHYTYDAFKRVARIRYDAEPSKGFDYTYGANGAVAEVKDTVLNRTAKLIYDTAERPAQAELWENTAQGDKLQYHLIQQYDEYNQPSKLTERVLEDPTGGERRGIYATEVFYDIESRPTEVRYSARLEGDLGETTQSKVYRLPSPGVTQEVVTALASGAKQALKATYPISRSGSRALRYGYDRLGRITKRELYPDAGVTVNPRPALSTELSYWTNGNKTAPLVTTITQAGRTLDYAYDTVGNITSVVEKGGQTPVHDAVADEHSHEIRLDTQPNSKLTALPSIPPYSLTTNTTGYAYDKLGQLTRVNDERAKETWTYEYDQGGNILSKKRYAYATGAVEAVLETVTW